MRTELALPQVLGILAEVSGKAGQPEEGLRTLSEALEIVNRIEERYYEAELYRLKGTLTLKQFRVRSSEFRAWSCQHPTPYPLHPGGGGAGGGGVLSEGHQDCTPVAGEVTGVAGSDKFGSPIATAGQDRGSPRTARPGL
jgi:hypothetical protein